MSNCPVLWLSKSERLSEEVKKCIVHKRLSDYIATSLLKFNHTTQNKFADAIIKYELKSVKKGRFLFREFIKAYEVNPEQYTTVESLEELANEIKGVKKVLSTRHL